MKKLRVAVCDDDSSCLENIQNLLLEFARELGSEIEVLLYPDGADLTEKYPEKLDALFLDIEMPFLNGLDTAREIRRRDQQVLLVLMSNYEKYAIRGYEFGAWRYLLKPVTRSQFDRELRHPLEELVQKEAEFLYVKNSDGVFSVSIGELLYASTNPKKTVDLHLTGRALECYQTLTALEEQLTGKSFFRCHSGFLVNLAAIAEIRKDFLLMQDDSLIPVSKHRKKELMSAFLAYAGSLL